MNRAAKITTGARLSPVAPVPASERTILQIARLIRAELAAAFPDRPDLRGQCRRAGILCTLMLDGLSSELGITASMRQGWITDSSGGGHIWGHHWVMVTPRCATAPR